MRLPERDRDSEGTHSVAQTSSGSLDFIICLGFEHRKAKQRF